jgi:hypothetical protein
MSGELIKHCPACGHANDPAEIYCKGVRDNGNSCQYNLMDVEASPPAFATTPSPPPVNTTSEISVERSCLNGHPLAVNDQLCLICGAEPAAEHPALSSAAPPPTPMASADRLCDVSSTERQTPAFLRSVLQQLDAVLFHLQRQGRCASELSPEQVLILSRDPLRLSLSPGSEREEASAGADLSSRTGNAMGRYTSPERLVGIQAPSSDWWSLGLTLLELMVGPDLWQDIHPQAWQLQVISDGVPIPETITDPWRTLLRGLLTRDPQ